MGIRLPEQIPIDKILSNLAEKITRLELENSQYEVTIQMYKDLAENHDCSLFSAPDDKKKQT